MGTLQINLLGEPDIRYQGQSLKFPTRKVLALLIYLVVEGALHRREKLVTLFWPESDPPLAKAALRNTLTRLRQVLQVAETYIVSEAGVVGFDFEGEYVLDLHLVTEALKSSQPPTLHQALERYRGDFLTAFSLGDTPEFDDWVSVQRQIWRQRLDVIFDQLSQHQLDSGDIPTALTTTQRWLLHDPLHEAAYRRLMQLHSLAGNRGAALEAFETCQRILAGELGAEPTPETIDLAQRIKDLRLPIADLRLNEANPNRKSEIVNPKSAELPLAGRAPAYAHLTESYRQTPQLVVVEGEAGIGKTRLVTEFLNWAALQGADVLKGRAFEMGGRLAYQPAIDALRERLEAENAPEDLLDDVWLAELSRILPELRERYPDLPAYTSDESLAQSRLFESVARLGEALSDRRSVVLFIDDVQWTDDATRDLLHYVGRRWGENNASILLVLTLRSETLSAEPELRAWLTGLERDMSLSHLPLQALTADDTQQLVEMLAGSESHQPQVSDFADWLFQETGGNPFFIDETLKTLFEEGILQTDEGQAVKMAATLQHIEQQGQVPIPATVRKAILIRLERLDGINAALLTAATVIGRDCSFELLSAVSGLDEVAALEALETLLARRLLIEQPDTRRPYLVAHDKIRDVVYTEAGEARRRIYHRRTLGALEERGGSPAEMAHHALAAYLPDPAFRYSLAAGDAAVGVYAHTEAITHYRRALELVKQVEAGSADLIHLCASLGRTLEVNAQFDQALATYEAIETLAREQGDRALELAALAERAKIYSTMTPKQNPERGQVLSGQALALARKLGDKAAEAKILWHLALLHLWGGGSISRSVAYGEQALALARQLQLQQLMASIMSDLCQALIKTGQLARAETLLKECRELDNGSIDFAFESWFYYLRGEFEQTVDFAASELQAAQANNNLWRQALSQFFTGRVYMEMGQPAKAIHTMQTTLQLAEQVDCIPVLLVLNADLGWIYGTLGAVKPGLEVAQRGLALANAYFPHWRLGPLSVLVQLHIYQGKLVEAKALLEEGYADYDWDRIDPDHLLAVDLVSLELALARKDYERVVHLAEATLTHIQQLGYRVYLPEALFRRGQALLVLNRPVEAATCLREARARAKAIHARRLLWQILAALAEAEEAQGNEDVALKLRDEARTILNGIIEHIPEGELRTSFVGSPEVKTII